MHSLAIPTIRVHSCLFAVPTEFSVKVVHQLPITPSCMAISRIISNTWRGWLSGSSR